MFGAVVVVLYSEFGAKWTPNLASLLYGISSRLPTTFALCCLSGRNVCWGKRVS